LAFAGCTPAGGSSSNQGSSGSSTDVDAQVSAQPEPTPPPSEDAAAPVAASEDAAVAASAADAAPAIQWAGVRTFALRPGARVARGTQAAHGSTAWVVALAVASGASPELQALFTQLTQQRYAATVGEVNCMESVGDAAPSGVPNGPEAQMVTVSFRNERDARAFAAALTESAAWVGRARVRCAD
jgi:hypothetical protein